MVTPRGVATAPRTPVATPGSTSARVTWVAPLSNGGSAITGYTVRAYKGTALVATVTVGGSTLETTFSGLTAGTGHTFSVTATNAIGTALSRCAPARWCPPPRPRGLGGRTGRRSAGNSRPPSGAVRGVTTQKRIGFLSFGHWQPIPGSQVRTGRDALVQSVELAVAAEELGLDGAFVRVHHFARQLASPFPLLAAMAARTSRIEIGTGVVDMRYENPLYMAEEAAATDLISGGRLQLGISRGSPETALRGSEAFGFVPPDGQSRRRPRPREDGAVPGRDLRAHRCGRRPAA